MKRTSLGLLLVSAFVFAIVSIGFAQTAEDLVKSQSPGVTYVYRWVDDHGSSITTRYTIRGNVVTEREFVGPMMKERFGSPQVFRIIRTYTEGNRVILERAPGGNNISKFIVDGDVLTYCRKWPDGERCQSPSFMRE